MVQQDARTTVDDREYGSNSTALGGRYISASPTRALILNWFEQSLVQADVTRAHQLIEFMDPADRELAEKRLIQFSSRTRMRGAQPTALRAVVGLPTAPPPVSTVPTAPIRMLSYLARQLLVLVGVVSLAFVLLVLAAVAITDSNLGPRPTASSVTVAPQAVTEPAVVPQEEPILDEPATAAPTNLPPEATDPAPALPTAVPPTQQQNLPVPTPTAAPGGSVTKAEPTARAIRLNVISPEEDAVFATFPQEITASGTESLSIRLTLKSVFPFPVALLVTYGQARAPITQTFDLGLGQSTLDGSYHYIWSLAPDDLRELPNGTYSLVFEQANAGAGIAPLRVRTFAIMRESAVVARIRVNPTIGTVALRKQPSNAAQSNGVVPDGSHVKVLSQIPYTDYQQALNGFSYQENNRPGRLFFASYDTTGDKRNSFGGDAKSPWCLVEAQDGRRGWVPCNVLTVDHISFPQQLIPQILGEY